MPKGNELIGNMTEVNYVTVKKYAELSGYSVKAIRHKIYRKQWREGFEFVRAPDNRIMISKEGVAKWLESTTVLAVEVPPQLRFSSCIKGSVAGRPLSLSPLPLT